jgi:hypothetical protein
LGLPWFRELEPTISWKQGKLLGELLIKTSSKVLEINKTTLATSWAIQTEADKTRLSEKDVPEQYKDYVDVFSKKEAKRFPPKREEDHQIKFTDNVLKYFKGGVYLLTVKQTTFLRKWGRQGTKKGVYQTVKITIPLSDVSY